MHEESPRKRWEGATALASLCNCSALAFHVACSVTSGIEFAQDITSLTLTAAALAAQFAGASPVSCPNIYISWKVSDSSENKRGGLSFFLFLYFLIFEAVSNYTIISKKAVRLF